MTEIKPRTIIEGPLWPEPVEINLAEEMGGYVRIVGASTLSRDPIDQLLPLAQVDGLVTGGGAPLFSEDPWKVFLALETGRSRFASLYDPLLAMNTSKVDPLPHQIEALYSHVLKRPWIRFLIADDPGAGKTNMAGLVIKERKLPNLATRIFIVAPGHLKDQWHREMAERFRERFLVIDRGLLDALYGLWRGKGPCAGGHEKLRAEGEALERIAAMVLKEKYLAARDWVLTEQRYQSALRTPGGVRPVGRGLLDQGIAEGVAMGLFGQGELEGEVPVCRNFKEHVVPALSGKAIVISEAVCREQWAQPPPPVPRKPGPEHPEKPDVEDSVPGPDVQDPRGAEVFQPRARNAITLKFRVP